MTDVVWPLNPRFAGILAGAAFLFVLLVQALVCGALARRSAKRKGHAGYFWTGFLLGPLGVAYVAGLPDKYAQWERQTLMKKIEELQRRLPQLEK